MSRTSTICVAVAVFYPLRIIYTNYSANNTTAIIIYYFSPIGFTPSKSPTPDPTWEPTVSFLQMKIFTLYFCTHLNKEHLFLTHFSIRYDLKISPTYYPTMSPTVTAEPTAKPTFDPDDPSLTFFCGFSWAQADETCGMRCPSGNSEDCPG